MIEFQILGTPIAKKRPKFGRRGNFVQVYNPTKKDQNATKIELHSEWTSGLLTGPLRSDGRPLWVIHTSSNQTLITWRSRYSIV
jgi:hypothetical protein